MDNDQRQRFIEHYFPELVQTNGREFALYEAASTMPSGIGGGAC